MIRRKKLSEHIKQIIEQYGGNVDLQKKVYELTGFERQIIEIYKAIENNVKILCVYGLGENCTAEELGILRDILGKMKENGIGIIFIHYNSEKIQKFCDRILIMRHGFLADEVETAETSEQDLFRRLSAELGRKSAERKSPGRMVIYADIMTKGTETPKRRSDCADRDRFFSRKILRPGRRSADCQL